MNMYCNLKQISTRFLLFLALCLPAGAKDWYVSITDKWTFEPVYFEIQVGDRVTWTNNDNHEQHRTLSRQDVWDSGPIPCFGTFTFTFTRAGEFDYWCPHCGTCARLDAVAPPTPPPSPALVEAGWTTNGFRFRMTNLVSGKSYVVQSSTNLTAWTGVCTNLASGTSATNVDNAAAAGGARFYRVVWKP